MQSMQADYLHTSMSQTQIVLEESAVKITEIASGKLDFSCNLWNYRLALITQSNLLHLHNNSFHKLSWTDLMNATHPQPHQVSLDNDH